MSMLEPFKHRFTDYEVDIAAGFVALTYELLLNPQTATATSAALMAVEGTKVVESVARFLFAAAPGERREAGVSSRSERVAGIPRATGDAGGEGHHVHGELSGP